MVLHYSLDTILFQLSYPWYLCEYVALFDKFLDITLLLIGQVFTDADVGVALFARQLQ